MALNGPRQNYSTAHTKMTHSLPTGLNKRYLEGDLLKNMEDDRNSNREREIKTSDHYSLENVMDGEMSK